MHLGLYRREHLHSGNPELIGAAVVEQFQRDHAGIGAWRQVEHTDDGHHTDIHADSVTVTDGIYEAGQSVAMGHWQDVPFSPANFSASGGMTWTVGAPAVARNRYAVVGKTLTWSLYLSWFSGSNLLGGAASNTLIITLPGVMFAGPQTVTVDYQQNVAGVPVVAGLYAITAGNGIQIQKGDQSNFTPGLAVGLVFSITLEIL